MKTLLVREFYESWEYGSVKLLTYKRPLLCNFIYQYLFTEYPIEGRPERL